MADMTAFREALASSKRIIILSGAGLSVASGIPTFRGKTADHEVNFDLHTREAFERVPVAVWSYHQRMRLMSYNAKPNAAHKSFAVLNLSHVLTRVAPNAATPPLHVTQNVDGLAVRVLKSLPSDLCVALPEQDDVVLQMHGSIFSTLCTSCKHIKLGFTRSASPKFAGLMDRNGSGPGSDDIPVSDLPRCGGDGLAGSNRYGKCGGLLRPNVVWFGEIPPQMGEIARKMNWCDLLIVVGTSFSVQPAAGFAKQVKDRGGKVAIFNMEPSDGDTLADFLFLGKCEELLPRAFGVEEDIAGIDWTSG